LETEFRMNDMTAAVRRAVDQLPEGALGPMLDLLAEDVEFEVAGGGDEPGPTKDVGKQAVLDYFTTIAGLVAFWQLDYSATGGQVIAWGKESFTVEHAGLEGGCEFALVFELARGTITRFLVIENVPSECAAGTRSSPAVSADPSLSYRWGNGDLQRERGTEDRFAPVAIAARG